MLTSCHKKNCRILLHGLVYTNLLNGPDSKLLTGHPKTGQWFDIILIKINRVSRHEPLTLNCPKCGLDSVNSATNRSYLWFVAWCVTNEKNGKFSFQCYLKDEGRSLIYALREEYINHFMVL